jgi:hypothetical protein
MEREKQLERWLTLPEDDNPFFDVNNNKNFDQNDSLNGNIQLSFDPAKWLNLTAIMGVDYFTNTGTMFFIILKVMVRLITSQATVEQ